MSRRTIKEIEEDLRKRIEMEYRPWPICSTPEAELKFDGLEYRIVPTGYIDVFIQKARMV